MRSASIKAVLIFGGLVACGAPETNFEPVNQDCKPNMSSAECNHLVLVYLHQFDVESIDGDTLEKWSTSLERIADSFAGRILTDSWELSEVEVKFRSHENALEFMARVKELEFVQHADFEPDSVTP